MMMDDIIIIINIIFVHHLTTRLEVGVAPAARSQGVGHCAAVEACNALGASDAVIRRRISHEAFRSRATIMIIIIIIPSSSSTSFLKAMKNKLRSCTGNADP